MSTLYYIAWVYGVPEEICAVQYANAILKYKDMHVRNKLKEIHFVDLNHRVVRLIQNTFKTMIQGWKYDIMKYVSTKSWGKNITVGFRIVYAWIRICLHLLKRKHWPENKKRKYARGRERSHKWIPLILNVANASPVFKKSGKLADQLLVYIPYMYLVKDYGTHHCLKCLKTSWLPQIDV